MICTPAKVIESLNDNNHLISIGNQLALYWEFKPSVLIPGNFIYYHRTLVQFKTPSEIPIELQNYDFIFKNIVSIIAVLRCHQEIYRDSKGMNIFQLTMYFKNIDVTDYLNDMISLKVISYNNDDTKFADNILYCLKDI